MFSQWYMYMYMYMYIQYICVLNFCQRISVDIHVGLHVQGVYVFFYITVNEEMMQNHHKDVISLMYYTKLDNLQIVYNWVSCTVHWF